jgi:peptidoglycan-N-acetylglucosamine deacetylase
MRFGRSERGARRKESNEAIRLRSACIGVLPAPGGLRHERPDTIAIVNAIASTLAAATAVIGSAWAVRGRSSSVFAPSIWRGPRDSRAIALTFDDGPSESTPALLDLLARNNAPATFFQCGLNVERLPQIARAAREAGHEIGNHAYSHPMFSFHTSSFMRREMQRAQQAIEMHAGATPTLFRAPYGVRWPGLRSAQTALGLTGVMWTVIGYDWNLAVEEIVRRISGKVSNGAIICLHDGRELRSKPDIRNTIRAVETLIPMLLDRGYRFETVSRLCQTT